MLKLGLIGYPVAHSMSPWIHGKLMEQQGIEGNYDLIEIEPDQFDREIEKLKQTDLDGFNVTVPFKEKVMPFLDNIADSAKVLGAVNTVQRTEKGWTGHNTDGTGFVASLKQRFPKEITPSANVLILGSGGAARGIYYALLQEGVKSIDIGNRTEERASAIIRINNTQIPSKVLSLEAAASALEDYQVIIQTSSVGMSPHDDVSIIPLTKVSPGTVVSDIVYKPLKTEFLRQAEKYGAKIHFGHEMLLNQAVYAFQIWTGTNPDADEILIEFEKQLKGV